MKRDMNTGVLEHSDLTIHTRLVGLSTRRRPNSGHGSTYLQRSSLSHEGDTNYCAERHFNLHRPVSGSTTCNVPPPKDTLLKQFNAVNWSLASYMLNQTTTNQNTSPTPLRPQIHRDYNYRNYEYVVSPPRSDVHIDLGAQATSSTARSTASSIRHREALNLLLSSRKSDAADPGMASVTSSSNFHQ